MARSPVLGVDPRLVLVLEFHSAIDPGEIKRNGMILLDGSSRHAVVAFADDPDLTIFHERLAEYAGDIPEGQKGPRHQTFFDAVENIRAFGPADRVSSALATHLDQTDEPIELRLDVRCWHPNDPSLASDWLEECRSGARAAGGRVVTVYRNDSIGLLVARVFLPSDHLHEFAKLDVIASIDLLPSPELSIAEFHSLDAGQLPEMAAPAANAPILGLIDSGVASAHPLLAGSIAAAEALSPHIADGEDRHGHGTMVASLALHGHIPSAIRAARMVPIAKIVSVAVLDADAAFPDESLWESDVAAAIDYCAKNGARVINLSIGDVTRPFVPPRQPAVAAIIDHLARLHDLVVVVSTGNALPDVYLSDGHDDPTHAYVADLLEHPETGIIPPGTAALALTVGGISAAGAAGGFASREPVERRPFGLQGWPSTVTRRGPGVEGAQKPELVAPSGTHSHEPGRVVVDTESGVIGASARQPGRLLTSDLGTSYAAPLVARIALGVLARYPDFSANMVRALTLIGASPVAWDGSTLSTEGGHLSEGRRKAAVRSLVGYGQSSLDSALEVSPHRAILVAEGEIAMDTVHVYELPIPQSFYESGGARYLDVALAFDPPARSQRLDYLGNKIEFHVVRDVDIDHLLETFAKVAQDDGSGLDEGEPGPDRTTADEDDSEEEGGSTALRSILGRKLVDFDSTATVRSRSANQLGRRRFSQRWEAPSDGATYVVVRSLNRWCDRTLQQPYALAVSLRRDQDRPEIYAELAASLEAVLEVEFEETVEIEAEL